MLSPAPTTIRRLALTVALCASGVVVAVPAGTAMARTTPRSCADPALSVHTVVPNDTWFGIARRAEVRMTTLAEANGAEITDVIHPGDVLCLPAGATPIPPSAPSAPSTPSNPTAPAPVAPGTCPAARTYTVAPGDGWFRIAQRTGSALAALLKINDAPIERVIHPGQPLCLPEGATPPTSSGGSGIDGGAGVKGPTPGVTPGDCSSTEYQYTVRPGDGWYVISTRVGTSMSSLLTVNDASVNTVLHAGKMLCLPADARPTSVRNSGQFSFDAHPIQGPCWFGDTWHDNRGNGRLHVGADLFAATDSYVYAVKDGTLTRQVWDQPGGRSGNAWYLTDADGTYYFYAHLSGFAPGLQQGSKVKAGQIIGYMGGTGNAAAPHLHFEVHPYGGEAVDPHAYLRKHGACKTGEPYPQPGG
jgi:LysM repeat protein